MMVLADVSSANRDSAWHALEGQVVLQKLGTEPSGLSDDEATRRLESNGPNRLPQGPHRSALMRFLVQFHNLLIYMLLAVGVLAAAIGHRKSDLTAPHIPAHTQLF